MESREISPQDWPKYEQSGELGNIIVFGGDEDAMLCYYEKPLKDETSLCFVYKKGAKKEARSRVMSLWSLVAHNPYWDEVDEQPPQEELRRWAALPQVKDIYGLK